MNYNKEMEKILDELKTNNKIPRLLLHSCCAPCSSHVISVLTNYFDITILYYNPNIEPFEEYEKRKEEEIRFINEYPNKNKLDIIDCDYDNNLFKEMSKGLENEPERGARCIKCYYLRLDKTANCPLHGGAGKCYNTRVPNGRSDTPFRDLFFGNYGDVRKWLIRGRVRS